MDTTQIVELYDTMGQVSERAGWGAPMFTTDSMRDYFVAGAPTALYYERHGVLVTFVGALGAAGLPYSPPRDVLLEQLAQTHFLALTHRRDVVEPPYPKVNSIEEIRPQMEAFARDHMVHIGQYRIFGRSVDLYSRPIDPVP